MLEKQIYIFYSDYIKTLLSSANNISHFPLDLIFMEHNDVKKKKIDLSSVFQRERGWIKGRKGTNSWSYPIKE